MRILTYVSLFMFLFLSSCSGFYNQPTGLQKAVIGEGTAASSLLKNLPTPKEQVVVGVYKFRDQTGQYKPQENGSSFSTAVTQGATSILIKALEDSKWFIPIERENVGNLLQERNLIRSTRQEYNKNANPNDPQLTPLLYAGVLLEGGIISYDSNIITGGFGARYFGAGGSVKYRQDRVTIYLRMVSTSNGKILKSVYISKTILSQAVDQSLFRYVNFKRLLEVETGYTTNEPIQMAVSEAIEKAVESIVLEGISDGILMTDDPKEKVEALLEKYKEDNEIADNSKIYNRILDTKRASFGVELSGGAALINGDYSSPKARPFAAAGIKLALSPSFLLSASTNIFALANKNSIDTSYVSLNLNTEWILLPKDKLSPFIYAGGGYGFNSKAENNFTKVQFGAGLEYLPTRNLGIRIFGEYNISFSDNLDYLISGIRDDYYYKFGVGLTYYFGKNRGN
ncbi:curli biogenesis system outer membrane secretion channel CsgG [Flavobacterium sp. PL11]|jgi:curli biogenesis system outer membrane secretion channel CsgG|uniref:CsgG/HfaB family protein n=1 Tax=Flavobacterium sp. PL11 TaxID=3071717 RepID=UPI002E076A26|nr:curli biogenesis system outer membrane secretion channel CsgG [Flavobacterium sp. PL11]